MHFYLRRFYVLWLLLSLLSLFPGCQRPPRNTTTSPQSYNTSTIKALSQLSYFRVSGKVGFRQGETGGQAKFSWEQTGNDFTLQLMNPFGGEEARLSFKQGQYSLALPNQAVQQSQSIEYLFKKRLGWSAPVAHLSYWIRGLPLPGLPKESSYDAKGARVLKQDHWTITYSTMGMIGELPLPQTMVLERLDLPDGVARLKMVLHWSLE